MTEEVRREVNIHFESLPSSTGAPKNIEVTAGGRKYSIEIGPKFQEQVNKIATEIAPQHLDEFTRELNAHPEIQGHIFRVVTKIYKESGSFWWDLFMRLKPKCT